jgi:hypothetical protein
MKTIKFKYIFYLVFISIIVTAIYINNKETDQEFEKLTNDFPRIKIDEQINGTITGTTRPKKFRNDPCSERVTINGSIKRHIISEFYEDEKYIDNILFVGTHIYKDKGSDTVVILNTNYSDTTYYRIKLLFE